MSSNLTRLAGRIRSELVELEQVVARIQLAWQRAMVAGDDLYLDSVALNLHGFYDGLERIFRQIATLIDGDLPQGDRWHLRLLRQMGEEAPGVRPAIISSDTQQSLDEFRSFRHLIRNIYTFQVDPAKIAPLVEAVADKYQRVKTELLAFAEFLEQSDDH